MLLRLPSNTLRGVLAMFLNITRNLPLNSGVSKSIAWFGSLKGTVLCCCDSRGVANCKESGKQGGQWCFTAVQLFLSRQLLPWRRLLSISHELSKECWRGDEIRDIALLVTARCLMLHAPRSLWLQLLLAISYLNGVMWCKKSDIAAAKGFRLRNGGAPKHRWC